METEIKKERKMECAITLWRNLHAYLAMFFLPMAILFALTGALYIFGITGALNTESYEIELKQPLPRPLAQHIDAQEAVMVQYAQAKGIEIPAGKAKKGKQGVILGSATGYHLVLVADRAENTATLQVNRPGLYYKAVMLHKAKCGMAFKVMGVGLGITMIVLYLSGIFLFLRNRGMRNKLLWTCLAGLIVMLITGYLSL